MENHLHPDEHGSALLVVSCEALPVPGKSLWFVRARTPDLVKAETAKLVNAVSEDGFAFFTAPKQMTGQHRFQGWFASTGVTYDLL